MRIIKDSIVCIIFLISEGTHAAEKSLGDVISGLGLRVNLQSCRHVDKTCQKTTPPLSASNSNQLCT